MVRVVKMMVAYMVLVQTEKDNKGVRNSEIMNLIGSSVLWEVMPPKDYLMCGQRRWLRILKEKLI